MKEIYVVFFSLALILLSCKGKQDNGNLYCSDANSILKINDKDAFLKAIENNAFWKKNMSGFPGKKTVRLLEKIGQNKGIWISYNQNNVFVAVEKAQKTDLEKLTDGAFKGEFDKGNLLLTTDDNFLKFQGKEQDKQVEDLVKSAKETAVLNMFLSPEKMEMFFGDVFKKSILSQSQGWGAWDVFFQDNIRMSGSISSEMLKDKRLKNLSQALSISRDFEYIVPEKAQRVKSFSFKDPKIILENQYTDLASKIEAIVFYTIDDAPLCSLLVSDAQDAKYDFIESGSETYKGLTISEVEENYDMDNLLDIFNSPLKIRYMLSYPKKDLLLLSDNKEILKKAIDEVLQEKTLNNSSRYNDLKKELPSMASYTQIVDNSIVQVTPVGNTFVCGVVIPQRPAVVQGGVKSGVLTAKIDADVIGSATWVKNHNTNKKEIVVQDSNMNLYLIDNNCKVLWKKKLDAPVAGDIWQADLLKNGKLQMVFATEKSVVAIDRKGNYVDGFPVGLTGAIGVEVFDYEGDLNYRIVGGSDKQVLMLDRKGQKVQGFDLRVSNLKQVPKHYRIGSKDYIVFKDGNRFRVVDRKAVSRVEVKDSYDFSDSPIFLKNNRFCFTTKSGQEKSVSQQGDVITRKKGLGSRHWSAYRHGTEVFLRDGMLEIGTRSIDLPAGDYSMPRIYKFGSKILVCLFDKSKISVYTQDGRMLEGFPKEATSAIDMTIDKGQLMGVYVRDKRTIVVERIL